MDRVDDSHADMAMLFEDIWNAYRALPWERTGMKAEIYFRDLVEFCVWEDYGLVTTLSDYFRALAPDDVMVLENVFADIVPERHEGGFDYEEEKALRYRVDLLVTQKMYAHFVDAAAELRSRAWSPIVRMAKAAVDAGDTALAMSVFAAADQPGLHQDYLRKECAKLLGEPPRPPPRPGLLRLK